MLIRGLPTTPLPLLSPFLPLSPFLFFPPPPFLPSSKPPKPSNSQPPLTPPHKKTHPPPTNHSLQSDLPSIDRNVT